MRVGAVRVGAVLVVAFFGAVLAPAARAESGRTFQISAGSLSSGDGSATSFRGEAGYQLGADGRLLISVERNSYAHVHEPVWGFSLQPAWVVVSDPRVALSLFAGPRVIAVYGENSFGDRRTFYDVEGAGGLAVAWRAGWTWGVRAQAEAIKSTGLEYGGFSSDLGFALRGGPYLQF